MYKTADERAAAVSRAWKEHDPSLDPWVTYADALAAERELLARLVGSAIVRATAISESEAVIEHDDAIADHALTRAVENLRARAGQAERAREVWRMKCPVDADQVVAVDLDVAMFERSREFADIAAADQIAKALEFSRRRNGPDWRPSATWWAFQINRETETTADAQRLLDEIVGSGR